MGRRGTVWGNGDEESLEWTQEESTSSDLEKKDRIFDPSTRRPGAPAAVANPKALERRATRPKNPKVIINPKNAQRTATSTLATRSTVAAARQSGSVPLTMWNDNSSEFLPYLFLLSSSLRFDSFCPIVGSSRYRVDKRSSAGESE